MQTYIETNCTIEHKGQQFESGGAVVTEQYVVAYLAKDGVITDWHGEPLGTYNILSTWKTPRSYVSSTMHSVECFIQGTRYTGRSAGEGMSIRAKRSTKQGVR